MGSKKVDKYTHGEDNLVDVTLSGTSHDTTGKTVSAFLVNEAGTAVLVGSEAGAAAGVDITITMDYSLVEPGSYELEVVANPNDANPILMLPNPDTSSVIIITLRDQRGA